MTNQEKQIELLGKIILDGNLSKEDRNYAIYWRDRLKEDKSSTDKWLKECEKDRKEKEQQCKFSIAWVGKCKNKTINNSDFCLEHLQNKCRCGKQATHECDATIGPMVCGALLCDSCRCSH